MSNTIIGQPYSEFYNLANSQRVDAAQQLFDASLEANPAYKIEVVEPQDERFYFVISERGEDGDFVETSRKPSKWAEGLAMGAAWDQKKPKHERPNSFDIESMGVSFELIALQHYLAQQRAAKEGVQA